MQNKKLFRVTIVGMIVTYTVLAIGFRLTTSSASSSKMTSVVSDVKTLIGVAHGYANATSGQMGGTYLGLTSIVSGDYPAPGLLPKSYTKSGIPKKFVYAAPCNELGCGSWAWYPAGAEERLSSTSYTGIFSSGVKIGNLPSQYGCVYWLTQAGFAGNTYYCYDSAYLPG
ncbi:hypothetical protein [Leptospirillum ferriphilum]|uniref:hypothetical protein n=1 Tax=Leptospirillum ferriphilum TaxID=178606 RepID=UPI0006B1ED82|nr:hypothetical protein [Leptospirillum ferriphilum]